MSYHLHISGESRDCDGRYSHGHDAQCPEPEGFADLEAIEHALATIYKLPDAGPVEIRIARLDDGRIGLEAGGQTDEGYWAAAITVCDLDDFDEDYSGYRDHTAEAAGY